MTEPRKQTYRSPNTGYEIDHEITPPRASAQALYEAHLSLHEAQQALDAARARVPSYTGQMNAIDYYGDEQEALNRAVDAFEGALVVSVREAAERRLAESMHGIGRRT